MDVDESNGPEVVASPSRIVSPSSLQKGQFSVGSSSPFHRTDTLLPVLEQLLHLLLQVHPSFVPALRRPLFELHLFPLDPRTLRQKLDRPTPWPLPSSFRS